MTIRDEKLQYDINRETAKKSALPSGKINKYEYLTVEEILPFNQQAKFTYSSLSKAFEKQTETVEDKGEKQIDALKNLKLKDQTKLIERIFQKDHENDEIKNELPKIKIYENRDNLFYGSSKQVYDSKVFKTIRSFGDSVYNHKIEQADLLECILSFNNKTKPRSNEDKNKKDNVFDSAKNLYEIRNAFKSGLFPLKSTKGTRIKTLTLK